MRVLRVFRVLRPLRVIKRAEGLRHVVQCMVVSIKTIGNIFIITVVLLFMFSVIAVQRLSGTSNYCTDPTIPTEALCTGTFIEYQDNDISQPELSERQWQQAILHFDNVPQAMLSLFTVITSEGWVRVMRTATDGTSEGNAPERDHRSEFALFFVIFIVVMSFFMFNIFVGYVIVTFAEEGERFYAHSEMDSTQRKCVKFCLDANPVKTYLPTYSVQKWVYNLVTWSLFESFIVLVICCNAVAMLMQYEGMPQSYEDGLAVANIVFTAIFTVEAVLKLFAYNPTGYFADAWNVLDFIIVVGSLADIGLAGEGISISFLRLFRVLRVFRVLSKGTTMRRLLWTFGKSFQSLPYVTVMLLLVFFVYAVVGMQLFGRLELDEEHGDGGIHRYNNFRNFPNSLIVLFRVVTGEDWQLIMLGSNRSPPDCSYKPEDGGTSTCGSPLSYVYFITFVLLVFFLVINLFVAVIMDNFEYLTADDSLLGPHHLPNFIEVRGRRCGLDYLVERGLHFL